jgi:cathepsin L
MKQPISVAVDAVPFIQYKSGILTCPTKFTINHAVVLVGMTDDYWLAKEQFGVNWG